MSAPALRERLVAPSAALLMAPLASYGCRCTVPTGPGGDDDDDQESPIGDPPDDDWDEDDWDDDDEGDDDEGDDDDDDEDAIQLSRSADA
jgi:hypothetical protein